MAANYLEELIAEWYEYQGFFVRRNVLVGKRARGGYECELDVVAFQPKDKKLVHIEPSMDADSWEIRERRFRKKFEAGEKYIPDLFVGMDLPGRIDQIALLGFASKQTHQTLGGGRIMLVRELLEEIFQDFITKHINSSAIPEHAPILRSFQFVSDYRDVMMSVWTKLG